MSRKTWSYVIVSIALAGTLQACGGSSDGGGGGTVDATDTTRPTITAFTLPATASSLTVSVSAFTATDNVAVTGYMVTQSATQPAATAAGWTATAPAIVTAAAAGSQTFFPWAKDGAGNVSAVAASQTVTITLPPDTTAPVVTAFTLPATAASLIVSVSTFTATDNVAVTGYMVTQSATPPGAGDAGWTASATATVTAAAAGSQTFFPWAKDAAGNVSAAFGTPATVTITIPPGSVAVTSSGTNTTSAVGADATFTFASVAGGLTYNISGFGPGDKLVFPVFGGQPNALSIVNPIPNDGSVTVQLGRNVGGQKFDITVVLDGLTALQDGQINDRETAPFTSFNAVFGANSIQQL
jgi:hypothetical protein